MLMPLLDAAALAAAEWRYEYNIDRHAKMFFAIAYAAMLRR